MASSTPTIRSKTGSRRKLITLVAILVLAMFPLAFWLNKKAGQVKQQVEDFQQLERMNEEEATPVGEPPPAEGIVINELTIPLAHQDTPAVIKVYWQPDENAATLLITQLAKLPAGEKYQVWGTRNGTRRSLGLYDLRGSDRLVVPVEKALMTDGYEITVMK